MIPEKAPEKAAGTAEKKRFYRKRVPFFALLNKIKLWPSRRGLLHGIQSIEIRGKTATIVTPCRKSFTVADSRNSRAARWLRNKWYAEACPQCHIPRWKLEKYASTYFRKRWGSQLKAPP
mgnify:FL=1